LSPTARNLFREKVPGLPKAFDKDNKKPLIKILGRSRNPFYKRGSWSPKATATGNPGKNEAVEIPACF